MSESKAIRQKTEREKEIENKPSCLWDPIENAWCNHYEYPPPAKNCKTCLIENIMDALEDRIGSEAMRWFIAYKKFVES